MFCNLIDESGFAIKYFVAYAPVMTEHGTSDMHCRMFFSFCTLRILLRLMYSTWLQLSNITNVAQPPAGGENLILNTFF